MAKIYFYFDVIAFINIYLTFFCYIIYFLYICLQVRLTFRNNVVIKLRPAKCRPYFFTIAYCQLAIASLLIILVKEVVPLIIRKDKSGHVFNYNFSDSLHPKLLESNHLD